METVKVLVINTGVSPVETERFDLPADPNVTKKTILSYLNKLGKSSHALVQVGKKFYVCDHTAPRGPSKEYAKSEVRYHPFMSKLI